MPNLQERGKDEKAAVVIEKRPQSLDGKALKSELRVEQLQEWKPSEAPTTAEIPKLLDVDYFIGDLYDTSVQAKLSLGQKYFQRYRPRARDVLPKFLRFFARKVSCGGTSFNVAKSRIQTNKAPSRLFISIKDPFIKYLNHGCYLTDKAKYSRIITELTTMLDEAAKGQLFAHMYKDYDNEFQPLANENSPAASSESAEEALRIKSKD